MRFTGRIRFDDVRNADLDVTVEVTDTHVRLVSGDESLGSWCLADVVANRLVANEFEIDLDGEVIVFLADDQVNFAYGAVQKMAEGWARYHAMNLVRRKRAVAGARRRNEPDRLETVRHAFVSAREELQRPVVAEPTPVDEPTEPEPAEPEAPPAEKEPEEAKAASAFWERVERATAAEEQEGAEQESPEDQEQPQYEEAPEEDERPEEDEPREAEQPEEDEEARPEEQEEGARPVSVSNFAGRLPRLDAFPRRRAAPPTEEVEEMAVPEDRGRHEEPEPAPEESLPEAPAAEQDPVESAVPEPEKATNGHREAPKPAGLGSYRDGHHPSETSGLRASFRSLMSRSKEAHEHSYVESTTAVGITRRVCLECGHVSIGVSE